MDDVDLDGGGRDHITGVAAVLAAVLRPGEVDHHAGDGRGGLVREHTNATSRRSVVDRL